MKRERRGWEGNAQDEAEVGNEVDERHALRGKDGVREARNATCRRNAKLVRFLLSTRGRGNAPMAEGPIKMPAMTSAMTLGWRR